MPDYENSQKVARIFQKLQGLPQAVGIGSFGANSAAPPAVDDFIRELNNANLTSEEQIELMELVDNPSNRTLHQFVGSGRYSKIAKALSELRTGQYKAAPQSVKDITAQMNQSTPEATQPQTATPETNTAETPAAPAENTNTAPTQETPPENTNTTSTPETPTPTPSSEVETPERVPVTEQSPEVEDVTTEGTAETEDGTETPSTPTTAGQKPPLNYLMANNGVPYYPNDNNLLQGPYNSVKDYSYTADTEGNRTMMNEPGEITPENSTITSVRDVTRQMRARTASRARPAEQQQQQPTAQPTNNAQAPAPQRKYTSAEIEGVDNSDIAPVNQGWYAYIRNQGYGSTSSILSQMGYSQDKIRRMLDSSGAIRPEFLGGR